MAHTMKAAVRVIEELQAVDRMTATIAKLEVENTVLLAGLKTALPHLLFLYEHLGDVGSKRQRLARAIAQARAAIEKAS